VEVPTESLEYLGVENTEPMKVDLCYRCLANLADTVHSRAHVREAMGQMEDLFERHRRAELN
jgi:hypothetical protein